MPTATAPKSDQIFIAWTSFCHGPAQEVVKKGERLPGDHPAVVNHPSQFVEDGVPMSSRPSELDGLIDSQAEQAAEREAQRREEFERLAASNRIRLQAPKIVQATKDFPAWFQGAPAMISRGSEVPADHELALAHPEHFKAV